MESQQIIYPVPRLLANPKVFMAIAAEFEGPDWETIANAFYDLIEHDILNEENQEEVAFNSPEVCFRRKPGESDTIQIILPDGNAVELSPTEGEERYSSIKTEEEFAITSTIYGRLVRAIEEAAPQLKDDIALCEPPTPANAFLRDLSKDCFSGQFHRLSDPEEVYDFNVEIVDLTTDILKASVKRAP